MIPGTPQILRCPHCGKKKEIMSLNSGNTFGSELWSDGKQIAPMLPEISYIQKCPHCGKYFNRTRQKVRYSGKNECGGEQGLLSFHEMKEAFAQFSKESFFDKEEEINVRMMLHYAYNDFYFRKNSVGEKTIILEDSALFRDNALWLIENFISDDVLKAEFYREIGDFETAGNILESFVVDDDFIKGIVANIKERLNNKDSAVFKIY